MSVVATFGSLAGALFGELIAPSRCAACDVTVAARVVFCPVCAGSVVRADPWDPRGGGCLAAFEYGGAIATAIARLKYEDRADLAPRLGATMIRAARRLVGAVELVVPVPLHPRRLAERGYNQAALLALPVARSLEVRVAAHALVRSRDTPRQTSLARGARLINVRRAFSTARPNLVRGVRVLLVDDVWTTGATLEGCARSLNEAGARQVLAVALARRR